MVGASGDAGRKSGATQQTGKVKDSSWNHPVSYTHLTQANLNAEVAKILGSKISKLNEAPQSVVTDNLLSNLGLTFGDRESRAASLVRNKSAHGKDDEVDIEWIRNLHIVRIRFHRMLLAMTSASDHYYDYFTIGRPTRGLAECIPDEISEKRC